MFTPFQSKVTLNTIKKQEIKTNTNSGKLGLFYKENTNKTKQIIETTSVEIEKETKIDINSKLAHTTKNTHRKSQSALDGMLKKPTDLDKADKADCVIF